MSIERTRSVTVRLTPLEYRRLKLDAGSRSVSEHIRHRLTNARSSPATMLSIDNVTKTLRESIMQLEILKSDAMSGKY